MYKIFKQNINLIFIISVLVLLISTIGVEPNILVTFLFVESSLTFNSFVNLIRSLIPLLIISIFIIIFIYGTQVKKKNELTINFFLLYLISTSFGYFLNYNLYDAVVNFETIWRNNYLVIQSTAFLFLVFYLTSSNENILKIYLICLLAIISIVYSYFLIVNFKEYFSSSMFFMYSTNYNVNGQFLNQSVPRSSGISRILTLWFIFGLIFTFSKKNKKLLSNSMLSILAALIYLFGSRTSISISVFATITIFFVIRTPFIDKVKSLLFIIIFSNIILSIVPLIKNEFVYKYKQNKINEFCKLDINRQTTKELFINYKIIFKNLKEITKNECDDVRFFVDNKTFNKNNLDDSDNHFTKDSRFRKIISNSEENLFEVLEDTYDIAELEKGLNILKKFNVFKTSFKLEEIKNNNIESNKKNIKKIDNFLSGFDRKVFYKKFYEVRVLKNFINDTNSTLINNQCPYQVSVYNRFLTGRLCHWYVLVKNNENIFFGNGARYDRKYLKWGASSAGIYMFVAGGFFGLFFYLYLIFRYAQFFFQFIILQFKKDKNANSFDTFLFFAISYFMIRSLVEVSFGYWGIDQLIFISIFIFYERFIYKKNKNYY